MKVHCLFEQSGTFKNEFKKLGYESYDYDILNDFGETDFKIDLFKEIENAYSRERESIFDNIGEDDLILAFFPCTRFEQQILTCFRGDNFGYQKKSLEWKMNRDLELIQELNYYYVLITKLVLICIQRKLKLVIENPYSTQHYLVKYRCLKPALIIGDRRDMGDFYKKPTMFYFVNCEPKNNFIFEPKIINEKKVISNVNNQVERSIISKDFANRFIREYLI